jgi:hypothetical protein
MAAVRRCTPTAHVPVHGIDASLVVVVFSGVVIRISGLCPFWLS